MSFDAFIKIDGVKGESKSKGHEDEIEVLSFHWGVTNTGSSGTGGGAGSGKCQVQDFSFVHKIDAASPILFQKCATGEHIKSAVVTVRKAGGDQQEYLKFTFTDVLFTAVRPGGSSQGADDIPLEEVSLNFGVCEYDYWPQKPDGSLGAKCHGGWDLTKNVRK